MKKLPFLLAFFLLLPSLQAQDLNLYYQANTFLEEDEIIVYAFNRRVEDINLQQVKLALLFDSLQSYAPRIEVDYLDRAFESENQGLRESHTEAYAEWDYSVEPPRLRRNIRFNGIELNYVWTYQNQVNEDGGQQFQIPANGAMKEIMRLRFSKRTAGLEADFLLASADNFSDIQMISEEGEELTYEVGIISSITYPVDWLSFEASQEGPEQVLLQWSTAREENNQGFDIERSLDGRIYQTLAHVKGRGNSEREESYYYMDNRVKGGSYYYRLRQQDIDGLFSYSPVVEVEVETKTGLRASFYPNPANESVQLNLFMAEGESYDFSLLDRLGRVKLQKEDISQKVYKRNIDLKSLDPGIYHMIFRNTRSGKLYSRSLIVAE